MGFLISVLLFFLATTLSAASEPANVYLFPKQPSSSSAPTLTTEEARLIITQRLGVSQYHSLHHASKVTLEFINTFGGQRSLLFSDSEHDSRSYLVMIVEGVSLKLERLVMESFQFTEPSFKISNPPSETANKQFISDMIQGEAHIHCNLDDFNLFSEQRLTGRSGFVQFGLSDDRLEEFQIVQSRMFQLVEKEALEVMIIMMPESAREPKNTANSYGWYDTPSVSINRRAEAPIELPEAPESIKLNGAISKKNTTFPQRSVLPLCHSSLDSCVTATNNCSEHGWCFRKYGQDAKACYTCNCVPTFYIEGNLTHTTYWAGAACSKEDVSGQFWLIAIFSLVTITILSWAIGLLFSAGEEKLPGVIGAGVSGPKAR